MSDRVYDLKSLPDGVSVTDDLWVLEVSYEDAAEYYPGLDFNPQQRVGLAAELYDENETPTSPQPMLQALPVVASMTRLSISPQIVRTPVVVKSRL